MERSTGKSFLLVFAALLALLALTVASSCLRLGVGNAIINIAIAMLKAGLIVAFFMDFRAAPPIARLAALAGVFFLLLLLGLTLNDFLTR